jgi:hypothetical protein
MFINLIYDPSVNNAPAGFKTALNVAAQFLDNLFSNPITVNIEVGFGENAGTPLGNSIATGIFTNGTYLTYDSLKADLGTNATSGLDLISWYNLPATDPTGGGQFYVSPAQEKAWGLLAANGTEIDGTVGFGSHTPFSYDPNNRAVPGEYDFIGVAEHELTHALGRVAGLQYQFGANVFTPMDLFRYSAPGVEQFVGGKPAYFSIDGGTTNYNNYDAAVDYGDWASFQNGAGGPHGDSFGYADFNTVGAFTLSDVTQMDVLGFNVASFPFQSIIDVTEAIYVGYFARGGDPVGFNYWSNALSNGFTIQEEAASFSVQAESRGIYPFLEHPTTATSSQISAFIGSVYQDLFNRAPDAPGESYWQTYLTGQLGNPQAVGTFILDVIYGSLGSDVTTIVNKVKVAGYITELFSFTGVEFSSASQSAYQLAHNAVAGVTSNLASVTQAETAAINFVNSQVGAPAQVAGLSGVAAHDLHLIA